MYIIHSIVSTDINLPSGLIDMTSYIINNEQAMPAHLAGLKGRCGLTI